MNPEDISKYFYCFTVAGDGFQGDGRFYKYLQKALSKTIKSVESEHLRLMFTGFSEIERSRLNRGVRGRLQDRLYDLMDRKKMRGFDVNYIMEQTRDMKIEGGSDEDTRKHEVHHLCRVYLEKIKYFNG